MFYIITELFCTIMINCRKPILDSIVYDVSSRFNCTIFIFLFRFFWLAASAAPFLFFFFISFFFFLVYVHIASACLINNPCCHTFPLCRRPTLLQDRNRGSDDEDFRDRDYDVAALASNLSQAFRYGMYSDNDIEVVKVHSLLLQNCCISFAIRFPKS